MNLGGKIVLITGATSGIGFEASVELARRGASLVMVGRTAAKTAAKADEVRRLSGSTRVESLLCDFASQREIRKLAEDFRRRHNALHVLVNNAGTVLARRTLTEDGIEATFAVNHLGFFLLTNLLLDVLLKSGPSRIVNVASTAHYRGTLDFEDLMFERGYKIMRAYSRSKLANVLFTRELARRLAGTAVTVNALHPGAVASNIWNSAPLWTRPLLAVAKKFMLSSAEGAKAIVYLASSPEVSGRTGLYFEKNLPREPSPLARDEALATRLWDESARLVKLPISSGIVLSGEVASSSP